MSICLSAMCMCKFGAYLTRGFPKQRIFSSSTTRISTKIKRGSFSQVADSDVIAFRNIVGNNILTDPSDVDPYNIDCQRSYRGKSSIVLRPNTTDQVSQILEYCNKRNLAVVPQGGNTGLVGGSVPVFDEVILSMSLLNKVISLDEVGGILTCEAGCVLEMLNDRLADKGLVMPIDLASKGSCQIGGNISTNAGGIRFSRYGSLHGNVLGLKIVLADGSILDCMSAHRKDNTGYDLKQLFIGAEGTLGIITELAVALPPKPKAINVVLLSCESFDKVRQIVVLARSMLGEILSATELMDSEAMEFVVKQAKLVNPLDKSPFYVLIETAGTDDEHDRKKLDAFLESLFNEGIIDSGTVAGSVKEANALWALRERLANALVVEGRKAYHHDLSLSMDDYYAIVEDTRRQYPFPSCTATGFGHIGDGNLHLSIITSSKEADDINSFVLNWTKNHEGSISAEHGLGVAKNQYIHYSKSQKAVSFMIGLKKMFDPKGILNPYKTLP